jgi:uncharacterized protein CbrC (UPF0167 family)
MECGVHALLLETQPAMTTFVTLGIPFPLYDAPVEGSEYVDISQCSLCEGQEKHCFHLGVGCAITVPCPQCGSENGLGVTDWKDAKCRVCAAEIAFPPRQKGQSIYVCHACLRAGKAAITKDTEFGMVSWEQAFAGVTYGAPGLECEEFERVLISPEEDWWGVRVPQEHLFELLRTPTCSTWQGERWLFCCKRPMTYIGDWSNVTRSVYRPTDPRTLFNQAVEEEREQQEWLWTAVTKATGSVSIYFFRCASCNRFRAHWDID